jgi:hypothetical protein
MGKKKVLSGWDRFQKDLEDNLSQVVALKKDEDVFGDEIVTASLNVDEIKLDATAEVNFTLTLDKNTIEEYLETNDGDIVGTVSDLMDMIDSAIRDGLDLNTYDVDGWICDSSIMSGGWLE